MTATALLRHFRAMARNNAWSNHRLHATCGKLSEAEYKAKRVSFIPSIHLTLNHILTVDWYYLDALEAGGKGPALYANEEPFGHFAELSVAQREADRRLLAFCDRLTEDRIGGQTMLVRGPDERHVETASAVLSHLFVHQIHHRGQVHAMLAGSPVAPPQLDEFFLEQDRPLRAAELRELGFEQQKRGPYPDPPRCAGGG